VLAGNVPEKGLLEAVRHFRWMHRIAGTLARVACAARAARFCPTLGRVRQCGQREVGARSTRPTRSWHSFSTRSRLHAAYCRVSRGTTISRDVASPTSQGLVQPGRAGLTQAAKCCPVQRYLTGVTSFEVSQSCGQSCRVTSVTPRAARPLPQRSALSFMSVPTLSAFAFARWLCLPPL
jgi:hypothetical protein